MKSVNAYRMMAEDCLRQAAEDEHDRPLWAIMAQSWLRLAEHAERLHGDPDTDPGADCAADGDEDSEIDPQPPSLN